MSGAQAKAATITGAVGVIAEIDPAVAQKRHEQGWVQEIESDLDRLLLRVDKAIRAKEALSLAFTGNIVDLWEALEKSDINVDLGSDQTSLHNPFGGGYYPVGQSLEDSRMMLVADPSAFKDKVQSSLRRHVEAINSLADQGMNFWDYGNAFLLEASRAGAPIQKEDKDFIYPSYVEDIMGPLCFDHGFGPFRWVCTSGKAADLSVSDALASRILGEQAASAPAETRQQLLDNKLWIEQAEANEMVVGSQARILYADASGRIAIASAFNDAIAEGKISAPIVLGRDHHDVSGTDSPYRETANIKDGSNRCADMAVHNVIGDAFRGASWVSLHNGGGVGWGEVINGGFGLLLDGSEAAQRRLSEMLHWDVNNGVARRAWAGNEGARFSIERAMEMEPRLKITLAEKADPELLSRTID
jgi:urocanate hydratase